MTFPIAFDGSTVPNSVSSNIIIDIFCALLSSCELRSRSTPYDTQAFLISTRMVCFLPTICCHGSPCLARFVTWILVSGYGICRYWKIGFAGCVYPEDELMIILRGLGWGFPRSGILEDDCPMRLQLSTVLVQKIDETAFWCMSGWVSEFVLWTVTSTYFLPNSSAWGLTEDSKELWIATTTRLRYKSCLFSSVQKIMFDTRNF